ncbi:MAG: hypothetical protein [Wendovervirus sonii]|uniref:Uncharacterized protein n=1 Tax=phage Lak_Megaphage_Sonny TaxID=3109229 RepID=A0ABZ0Z3U6_9CAUD|nr:MAG: hypothetical protein [phage Lak_Megaphage_Sonny]
MEKYNLVGVDGNAFSVMAYVRRAMKECGKTNEEISEYSKNAMSSNYDHLIAVSVDVINELNEEIDDFNPMCESLMTNIAKGLKNILK